MGVCSNNLTSNSYGLLATVPSNLPLHYSISTKNTPLDTVATTIAAEEPTQSQTHSRSHNSPPQTHLSQILGNSSIKIDRGHSRSSSGSSIDVVHCLLLGTVAWCTKGFWLKTLVVCGAMNNCRGIGKSNEHETWILDVKKSWRES